MALLIKPSLTKFLKDLDRSYENVISFELSFASDIIFVGCYISPRDSPYYDAAVFGHLQSLVMKDERKKMFIMGDLNSRVGVPTNLRTGSRTLAYQDCEDETLNTNGRRVLALCEDNKLVIINNLTYGNVHFKSSLSFRKKAEWISELDLLLCSDTCIEVVKSFKMIQYYENEHLCSDHAVIEFEVDLRKVRISTELLKERANNLGESIYEKFRIKIEKTPRLSSCNVDNVIAIFNSKSLIIISILFR